MGGCAGATEGTGGVAGGRTAGDAIAFAEGKGTGAGNEPG